MAVIEKSDSSQILQQDETLPVSDKPYFIVAQYLLSA